MAAGKKNKRSNQNSMSSLLRGLAVEKEQTLCFSTLIQVIKLTAGSLGSSDIHNNWLKNLFYDIYRLGEGEAFNSHKTKQQKCLNLENLLYLITIKITFTNLEPGILISAHDISM